MTTEFMPSDEQLGLVDDTDDLWPTIGDTGLRAALNALTARAAAAEAEAASAEAVIAAARSVRDAWLYGVGDNEELARMSDAIEAYDAAARPATAASTERDAVDAEGARGE